MLSIKYLDIFFYLALQFLHLGFKKYVVKTLNMYFFI